PHELPVDARRLERARSEWLEVDDLRKPVNAAETPSDAVDPHIRVQHVLSMAKAASSEIGQVRRPNRASRQTSASIPQTHNYPAAFQGSASRDSFQSFGGDEAPNVQHLSQAEAQPSRNPFEIAVYLVRIESRKRFNYDFTCHLIEPRRSRLNKVVPPNLQPQANSTTVLSDLDLQKIQHMIGSMEQLKDTPIDLVDLSQVQSSIASFFMDSSADTTIEKIDVGSTSARLDGLALAFAALAFSALIYKAFNESNFEVPLAFLELSMKTAEDYVGPPTLNLVLASFLQHICVLRTGTSNRCRALIAQAVQAAHDIGINRCGSSHNPLHTARLYLALYFTDQYCAMTYNTAPCIKPTDYDPVIFEPLRQATPELKNLVELVTLNGKVLDAMHTSSLNYDNVISLESVIGKACFTLGQPLLSNAQEEKGFEARYASLAQVHMFWSRIMLRTPFLMSNEHWLSSLSICIRAAQMLLSIYFDVLGPSILAIARADSPATDRLWKCAHRSNQLPPTWRQVRRIMTSVLVLFYAFWYGEVSYDEAGRAIAYALALLEFERMRWGAALNDSRRSILFLAAASGINSMEYIKWILPGANEGFIASVLDVDHTQAQADPTMDQQADDGGSSVLQDLDSESFGDLLSPNSVFSGVFPHTGWDFETLFSANLGGMGDL
ncbi:hypothetical protein IFM46972_03152, partial [Aspergillus udagawae]